ncbi:MAG TPA: hypothetical protein VFM32_05405 [Spongiibacteraceae bacterium]|nr:hypothetical protein [Spongiibacteraceae bacterium]
MTNALSEHGDLLKVMMSDVNYSVEKLNSGDENYDYYARAYLRSYASFIEGSIWVYKELIKRSKDKLFEKMPLDFQLYIYEIDLNIKSSGEPEVRNKKIKTKDNLKGFFYVISKLLPEYKIDLTTNEWSDISFFYSLRDKMMHPTSTNSLNISHEDIVRCDRGRAWLLDQYKQINTNLSKLMKTK